MQSNLKTRINNMNQRMLDEWGRIERLLAEIDSREMDATTRKIMKESLRSAQRHIDMVQEALSEAEFPESPHVRAKHCR